MTVLIGSLTPYVIWRVGGSVIGACRTEAEAVAIMKDMKASFPDRDFVVRDNGDGDVLADTRAVPSDA